MCPPPHCPRTTPFFAAIAPPKQVAVAVTSDKGLCGGLNSNITKYYKVLAAITPEGERHFAYDAATRAAAFHS